MDETEKQLRKDVRCSEGKEVARAARQLLKLCRDEDTQQDMVGMGADKGDLLRFSRLFAEGIQWVYEHYPEQAGPKVVLFGHAGHMINFAGSRFQVDPIAVEKELSDGTGDPFIVVPLEEVKRLMDIQRQGQGVQFTARARTALGTLAPVEMIFLSGVEESFHAVQFQDPALREKYGIGTSPSSAHGEDRHDTNPRELDVIPVLQQALAHFRALRRAEFQQRQNP